MGDSDAYRLEQDAAFFARLAVEYDRQNKFDQAKFYYVVSIYPMKILVFVLLNLMKVFMLIPGRKLLKLFSVRNLLALPRPP